MRNNLQPKCRMPWERAGVTLQSPGLSNRAFLFNRLLCFSIHFIHCYSSASAFLSPLHCWNRAAPTATFYCCAGRSRAEQGVLAPPPCNQGPLPLTAATATAHLHICAKQGHQALNTKLSSFIRSMQMTNFNSTVTSALSQFHS